MLDRQDVELDMLLMKQTIDSLNGTALLKNILQNNKKLYCDNIIHVFCEESRCDFS